MWTHSKSVLPERRRIFKITSWKWSTHVHFLLASEDSIQSRNYKNKRHKWLPFNHFHFIFLLLNFEIHLYSDFTGVYESHSDFTGVHESRDRKAHQTIPVCLWLLGGLWALLYEQRSFLLFKNRGKSPKPTLPSLTCLLQYHVLLQTTLKITPGDTYYSPLWSTPFMKMGEKTKQTKKKKCSSTNAFGE